jgi:hypothetical protein
MQKRKIKIWGNGTIAYQEGICVFYTISEKKLKTKKVVNQFDILSNNTIFAIPYK